MMQHLLFAVALAAPSLAVWRAADKGSLTVENPAKHSLAELVAGDDSEVIFLRERGDVDMFRKRRRRHLETFQNSFVQEGAESMVQAPGTGKSVVTVTRDLTNLGSEYTAQISMGTPAQPIRCVMDTGSSLLWVYSKLCTDKVCTAHHQFDGNRSNSYRPGAFNATVQFGTGRVSGPISMDDIRIGKLEMKAQRFGEIQEHSNNGIFDLAFDAICGLSFPISPHTGGISFLEGFRRAELPKEKSITFRMTRKDPLIVFGRPSTKLHKGDMVWYPVPKEGPGYWKSQLELVTIGDETLFKRESGAGDMFAIFDTGTSILTAPSSLFAKGLFLAGTPACSKVREGKAPSICFHPREGKPICLKNWYERSFSHSSICRPALMRLSVTPSDNIFILGQPLFEDYVATFDITNRRVGIAPPADS